MPQRAYESPEGFHRHQCQHCRCVWEHGDDCAGNTRAHRCPRCGRCRWRHYEGGRAPTELSLPLQEEV